MWFIGCDLGFGVHVKVGIINYHLKRHIGILCNPTKKVAIKKTFNMLKRRWN
jgi:hypothetical protein